MPDLSSSRGIRAQYESDGMRLILPRKRWPLSGPIKTLLLGIAMVGVPILAAVGARAFEDRINGLHTIALVVGFPFEVIGVILILAAVFGLLPCHCEVRLTKDWLIWVRWNGPLRFRQRWARADITGIHVVGDHSANRATLQLQGDFEETPEMGFGYPRDLLSELAEELTHRGEFGKAARGRVAEPEEPVGRESRPPRAGSGFRVVGWIILLLISAVGGFFGIREIAWQENAVTRFAPVTARVISSRVDVSGTGTNRMYVPHVVYAYEVGGQTYSGTQIAPFDVLKQFSSRLGAQDVIRQFQAGTQVTAYVNPDDPGDAILVREYSPQPYLLSIAALLAAPLGMVLLIQARRPPRPLEGVRIGGRVAWQVFPERSLGRKMAESLVLLLGTSAAIWPVWVRFLRVAGTQDAAMLARLFTPLMVILGLLCAVSAFRAWRKWRQTSDARLMVRPMPMKAGEPIELHVEIDARVRLRLNALRARVACREHYQVERHGRYASGKQVKTRVHVERVCELKGVCTLEPGSVLSGDGSVTFAPAEIPRRTRKPFPYYTWDVTVEADFARGPNYRGVFAVKFETAAQSNPVRPGDRAEASLR
ncbi:MAG: DUF3592 domain-containing protein [Tepidisphaeraceae bacterium]